MGETSLETAKQLVKCRALSQLALAAGINPFELAARLPEVGVDVSVLEEEVVLDVLSLSPNVSDELKDILAEAMVVHLSDTDPDDIVALGVDSPHCMTDRVLVDHFEDMICHPNESEQDQVLSIAIQIAKDEARQKVSKMKRIAGGKSCQDQEAAS